MSIDILTGFIRIYKYTSSMLIRFTITLYVINALIILQALYIITKFIRQGTTLCSTKFNR